MGTRDKFNPILTKLYTMIFWNTGLIRAEFDHDSYIIIIK